MRILILDDDNGESRSGVNRHAGFIKHLGEENDLTLVTTAQGAIDILRDEPKFDKVFLDHDLDLDKNNRERGMYGSTWRTGMEVASYIAQALPDEKRPASVVVHSHNDEKAPEMVRLLTQHGVRASTEPYDFAA